MDRKDGGERKEREGGDRQTQRERDMYVGEKQMETKAYRKEMTCEMYIHKNYKQ